VHVDNPQRASYNYYGVAVSNGLIGAVSQPKPFRIIETVLAGAYDVYGRGRVDNIVETMNVMEMDLYINGKLFNEKYTDYQQGINYKRGEFNGSYTETSEASITYNYTTLKNSPSTFYVEVEVTAHTELNIDVRNLHRIPEELTGIEKMYENVPNKEIYRVLTTKAKTKVNQIEVVLSSTFVVDPESRKYLVDGWIHEDLDSDLHFHGFNAVKVPKGHVFRYVLMSSLISSVHHSDPVNEAIRLLVKTASTDQTELKQKHYSLWE
jgi:protein-glucosylgalactosylhydroxylysine glucosidase